MSMNNKKSPIIILLIILILGTGFAYLQRRLIVRYIDNIRLSQRPPACEKIGENWTSPKDGMELVCVPAGEFTMGAPSTVQDAWDREKPAHKVFLDAYWIDKTEVTNAMFAKFVKETQYITWAEKIRHKSYVFTEDPNIVWIDMKGAQWDHPTGPNSDLTGMENYPVVHIHIDDALAYCKWAGRHLPSEAEWEKAARGDDERIYPWGNQDVDGTLANLTDKNLAMLKWANLNIDDGYKYTSPVGNYPAGASPYGALDMAGNVWEVVGDWADWNYYSHSPEKNPHNPANDPSLKQLPVIRGSSWYGNAWEARSFHRAMPDPNKSSVVTGFRCAQNLDDR